MATSTIDQEAIRHKCGLTRAQWSQLVQDEGDVPKVARRFDKFLDYTRRAIDLEFEHPDFVVDGVPYLSTIQVARALGLGEYHLSNLRWRGKITGLPHGRRTIYSKPDLLSFINTQPNGDRQSAVATAFMRWYALQER